MDSVLICVLAVFALWFVGGILLPARHHERVGQLIVGVVGFGTWLLGIGIGAWVLWRLGLAVWRGDAVAGWLGAAGLLILSGVAAAFLGEYVQRRRDTARRAAQRARWLGLGLLIVLSAAGCMGPFSADLRQCARPSAAAWSLVPLVGGASGAALEAEKERCMAERGWERRGFTYRPRDSAAPPPPTYAQSAAKCAAAYGAGPRFESCMVTVGWPLAEVQARGRADAESPPPK